MTHSISSPLIDPLSRRRLPAYLLGADDLARWHWRGACVGVDSELFFPGGRFQELEAEPAREICAGCPVRIECREHADSAPEPYGIWGGATPRERGWNTCGRRLKEGVGSDVS